MVDSVSFGSAGARPPVRAGQSAELRAPARSREHSAEAATPVLSRLAEDLAQQGPPVDYAKIAQLRQAIATGEYKVDPKAIARSITSYSKSV